MSYRHRFGSIEGAGLAFAPKNPLADAITVPIQTNLDRDIGPDAANGRKSGLGRHLTLAVGPVDNSRRR